MKKAEAYTQEPNRAVLGLNKTEIIKTLLYFDIFSFPLTLDQIFENCGVPLDKTEIQAIMNSLVDFGYVSTHDKQYFINGNKGWIKRKNIGAEKASKYLRKSRWMSRIISQFPFVRALGISGSLSKGYADEQSDVDYFVITKTGRLWLSRTLIILFKKIFLLNSRKWLCPNYFVDEDHLKIPDENPYTATEIIYLMPAYNQQLFYKFWDKNQWVKEFKPNFNIGEKDEFVPNTNSIVKRCAEWMMNGRLGEWLDDMCFKVTIRFWKKKFKDFKDEDFQQAFRSDKSVSKHHPQNFQKKILKELERREIAFEKRFKIKLANPA